ncbi:MAG: hypothetical protein ABFS41_12035 [Myxococcota bacterium]
MSRAALALALALALSGCRSAPVSWAPLAAEDPRPEALRARLTTLAEGRHGLRASGRVRSEGPAAAGFAKQLLLVERPARLRVEVLGLLAQRVLVLATDGERYALYRAEQAAIERGDVHPGVLNEATGLPLTPDAATGLLLAAPLPPPDAPADAFEGSDGGLSLRWSDQTLDFDAEGRLVALAFHPGGRETLAARWSEWRDVSATAFPHRLELELFEPAAHWQLDYGDVELNPELAPEWFELPVEPG